MKTINETDFCKCKPIDRIVSPPNPRRVKDGKIRKCGRCLKQLHDKFQYGNSIAEQFKEQPDDRQQCYKTGKECKYKCAGLCRDSC